MRRTRTPSLRSSRRRSTHFLLSSRCSRLPRKLLPSPKLPAQRRRKRPRRMSSRARTKSQSPKMASSAPNPCSRRWSVKSKRESAPSDSWKMTSKSSPRSKDKLTCCSTMPTLSSTRSRSPSRWSSRMLKTEPSQAAQGGTSEGQGDQVALTPRIRDAQTTDATDNPTVCSQKAIKSMMKSSSENEETLQNSDKNFSNFQK